MSKPEIILWRRLRALRERGYHFRRQAPLFGFYLDFVCYSRRMVVEVDGSQHGDDVQIAHDTMRDAILRRHGFTVLRFWTRDIRYDLGSVMDHIVLQLEAAPVAHGRATRPPPRLEQASPP